MFSKRNVDVRKKIDLKRFELGGSEEHRIRKAEIEDSLETALCSSLIVRGSDFRLSLLRRRRRLITEEVLKILVAASMADFG